MNLYPHQTKLLKEGFKLLSPARSIVMQGPTGIGKTFIIAEITGIAKENKKLVWIVAPRNVLLGQASDHLRMFKIPHSSITANSVERVSYDIHVVSKDTIIKRVRDGKIRRIPDLVIWDECHIALDQQIEMASLFPETTKFIGFTATPERGDGRGLSELYDNIAYGPSLTWLIENGYLTGMKYFCPPTEGVRSLKRASNGDYNAKELEDLLERKQVYGSAIAHYRQHANKKPCVVFCRSVKAAEDTAERFNANGYKFLSIDGKMPFKEVQRRIEALRTGEIHGLTSCDLITYGLDVPRIECIIMLRPTTSKALFFQMIGRGLRKYDGKYICIILDHVNNLLEHGHPLEEQDWNFYGEKKRGKKKGDDIAAAKLCPKCFCYFISDHCDNCGAKRETKIPKGMVEIEGRLVEQVGPVALRDRPREEQAQILDGRSKLVAERDVAGLLELAEEVGHKPLSVYHLIVDKGPFDEALLREIGRIKGYKHGWVERQIKFFGGRG